MNSEWMEVETLVRMAQGGDREAFGQLAERFQPTVAALARSRQRDAHEAAELVQEVFLHAMQKIGQLREPACFAGWLRKMTVRVAINRATRRPPFPTAEVEVLEQGRPTNGTPLDEVVRREQRDQVRAAVARLRPIDRDVLVGFYLKSKSLADIAAEFDLPIGTVKRRLHVARHRLEAMLARRPVAHDEDRPVAKERRARRRKLALATV